MDGEDTLRAFKNPLLPLAPEDTFDLFGLLSFAKEGAPEGLSGFIAGYHLWTFFPVLWPQIRKLQLRETDIVVATFPKSGTTWMQQIVYLIQTEDFEGARSIDLEKRSPYIEYPKPVTHATIEEWEARKGPRIIKTHLPATLLPEQVGKAKVIFVYRNAKDVCVSFYHHMKSYKRAGIAFNKDFEDFARDFMAGKILYGPYPNLLKSYYDRRHEPWLLMLKYEDIKADARGSIRKVAEFLGKPLNNDVVEKIYEETTFDSMRQNKTTNYSLKTPDAWHKDYSFIRKGEVGDWKNHFKDNKLLTEFEEYIHVNLPQEMIFETN